MNNQMDYIRRSTVLNPLLTNGVQVLNQARYLFSVFVQKKKHSGWKVISL